MTTDLPVDPWQLVIDIPQGFHSLGLHLDEDERAAHLYEVTRAVWPRGTEFQRETMLRWYAQIAEAAAQDGAFYSGFSLASTEDDRISTASWIARWDHLKTADPAVAVAGILEALSARPANEVNRVDIPCGPAVLNLTGMEWTPPAQDGDADPPLPPTGMARADIYVPLPKMSRLLALSMTTPSLPEFPEYVALLSHICKSIGVEPAPAAGWQTTASPTPPTQRTVAEDVRAVFG